MKKSIMKKWVTALRSGEFKQCKGKLDDGKGYCCLGVLSTIAMTEGVCDYQSAPSNDNEPNGYYDKCNELLPASVRNWARMKSDDGEIVDDGCEYISLVDENDSGKSFTEIADIIEANYKEL